MKNCLSLREPSKFKCKPWSFIANNERIGFPALRKILYVFKNWTLRFIHTFSNALFTSLHRLTAAFEYESHGLGIMADIIRRVYDWLLMYVIKFSYRLMISWTVNEDGISFVPTCKIVYLKSILASEFCITVWIWRIFAPRKHCMVVWRMLWTCLAIESQIIVTEKGRRSETKHVQIKHILLYKCLLNNYL